MQKLESYAQENMASLLPVLIQQTVQDQNHQNLTVVILNFLPY